MTDIAANRINGEMHARRPVNKQAAKVFFGGFNYVPDKRLSQPHFETPLPVRAASFLEKKNVTFVDLHGVVRGRLTVIGISIIGRGVWIVRCTCGMYTYRRARALKNENNSNDCCDYCRHVEYLRSMR